MVATSEVGSNDSKVGNKILTLITREEWEILFGLNEKRLIKACDGSLTFVNATDVFKGGVDSKFREWGLDSPSLATPEIEVEPYRLVEAATFEEMFKFFGVPLERLCLSKNQIVRFFIDNPEEVPEDLGGYETFFLFLKNEQEAASPENMFIASCFDFCGLYADVKRFDDIGSWCSNRHVARRLIIPKLIT